MNARRLTGLLIAVLAGALAGRALAPAPASQRLVRAGAVTLSVPSGWAPDRLSVAFGPPADRSLVPRALGARVTTPPRPVRLGGQQAWSYRARGRQVVVLPSSHGVLGLACAGDCAGAVTGVTVKDASWLTPTPELAFALRVRPALAALDASRVRLRASLATATTPSDRARSATALAREYALAAERLEPFAGPRHGALLDALQRSADAYGRLAAAAPAAFAATGRGVADADAGLDAAVARLRIGYAVQPAAAPRTATVRHWWRGLLLLGIAIAGALLAVKPTRPRVLAASAPVRGRAARDVPASRWPVAGGGPVASPPERKAPPLEWRWDAPPRAGGAGPLSAVSEPPAS